VSIIEPRKTLHAQYPLPPSQHVSIRVAADKAVNVYVLDQDALGVFLSSDRRDAPAGAIAESRVGTLHELSVELPVLSKWFLAIDNPWDVPTRVEYTVDVMNLLSRDSFGFGVTSGMTSLLGGPGRR
jgi:hypothetical protein